MHIAIFLHIYQPPTQFRSTLKMIAQQSYEKIVSLLEKYPEARITLNMNASLTEQLSEAGLKTLLQRISALADKGQIEFTGSAAYHPILPDLPKREIIHQINLNNKINQSILGSAYNPRGFFPPEMAYEGTIGEVIERLGFKWVIVNGTAFPEEPTFLRFIYRIKGRKLLALPREDDLSFRIAFGRIRTKLGLVRAVGKGVIGQRKYMILAMDGETFGHHQPKQLKFLRQLFQSQKRDPRINLVTISEIESHYPKRRVATLLPSTWGYTEEVDGERVWVRWRNRKNPLHTLLNELRSLAIRVVHDGEGEARETLDRGLNSDTYWWASGRPCWHPGMVDRGTRLLVDSVKKSPNSSEAQKEKAVSLHNAIVETGLAMFGRKKIAC